MALRFLQRRFQKGEPAFALMETVVAAAFSAVALTGSIYILNRQSDMAFKARDLALIQAAVNEDINAFRHHARFWRWTNSYYRPQITAATPPNEMIYQVNGECLAWWDKQTGGAMEEEFRSDLREYRSIPGSIPISGSVVTKVVPGYSIRRSITTPPRDPNGSSISTTTTVAPPQYTFRLTYTVSPLSTNPNGVKTFNSITEILLPAQFSC